MAPLENFVQAFQAAEDADKSAVPSDLAQLIQQNQTTLHSLVKALASVLTSENDKQRGQGIRLLALVVLKLPNNAVSRQEVRTLIDFFCSDATLAPETLLDALEGLNALAACSNFGIGDTIQVCKALFQHIDMKAHVQATRFRVFTLLDFFMATHRRALKRMGEDFLTGYCSLASGEKDPRNLRLAFGIVRVILVEFDISNKVEDLFDITFCYFPITFNPPPGDPYGISSEELQANLRAALSATPRFGPLVIPLVLDKLTAASQSSRRQCLQVFAEGFPIYGRALCEEQSKLLWEALLLEVYHATNAEFEALSFVALRSLLETLYPDELPETAKEELVTVNGEEGDGHMHGVEEPAANTEEQPITGIAKDICDHCLLELREADKSNAKSATKVLATMIIVSHRLASYVLPIVLKQMLERLRDQEQRSQRPAILAVVGAVLAAVRSRPSPYPSVLTHFGDELLSVLASALKPLATRGQALAAIVQLAQLPHYLAHDELVFIVQQLIALVVDEDTEEGEASSDDALEGIAAVAKLHPKVVEQHALPPLVSQLPEVGPSDQPGLHRLRATLSSLARICTQPDLFEALSLRLLSRIERVAPLSPAKASDELFIHLMLVTLRAVLEKKVEAGDTDLPKYVDRLVPNLFRIFLAPAWKQMDANAKEVASDSRLLADAGSVMLIIIQSLNSKQQATLAGALRRAYADGAVQDLLDVRSPTEVPFQPLHANAPSHQANTFILCSACLIPMLPEVVKPDGDASEYLNTMLETVVGWEEPALFLSGARLLASLVNKGAADLATFLQNALPAFWNAQIENDIVPFEQRVRSLKAIAWIARGLIVRSDNRGYEWLKRVMSLFPREDIGRSAARSLAILADDSDDLLSKQNHAVVKMLYKQRFFSTVLSQILVGYKASAASEQVVYLVALAGLLRHVPKAVSVAELSKLMPLLLRALNLPDEDLRINVMDTLAALATDLVEVLSPHATALASDLLRNALEGPVDSRLAALRCLGALPKALPYTLLHAQKPIVLRQLAVALDDKRKAVRREAVDARARWYALSG